MDQNEFEQFKATIIAAVEEHLASGGTLVSGQFTREPNCRCPISCITDPNSGVPYCDQIADKLGFEFSNHDVWAFIYGFDSFGSKDSTINTDAEIVCFGHEMRQKYLPVGLK